MTTIRCITMQKNEATLLEPWILWHGAIFGLDKLTVIDNGSTDPRVLDIQDRYEAQGVQIIRDHATRKDFLHKGEVIADIIRAWDIENLCDFAVPLDCDEFMTVFLDQLSVDPAVIRRQFDYLIQEDATFFTDRVLLNVPEAAGYFRPQIIRRGLFKAGTIVSLDRGFHDPQSIYRSRYVRTPFAYLHLHNRPDYEEIRRFARQKLGDPDQTELLETPRDGAHLHYYFQASQEEFVAGYQNRADIYAPVIIKRFLELGIDPAPLLGTCRTWPEPPVNVPSHFLAHRSRDDDNEQDYRLFDPVFYAQDNPDVAEDAFYGLWPLIHFLTMGWNEGRPASAANPPPLILKSSQEAEIPSVSG